MDAFSLASRQRDLMRATETVLDMVIVGAGITGCGVAREAALAGYSVMLLDKGDLASGTSSRSSKLIHGGVRYLAQGDIALVKESARERGVLRRIAPHLAIPIRMLIPVGSRRGKLKMAAGLWTFDKLAGDVNEPHVVMDRGEVLAAEAGLRPEHVAGGVAYTEFVTNDARLTLETAKSAAAAGAGVASYCEVVKIEGDAGGVRVIVDDAIGEGRLVIRARCLINAAGPWFDKVRGMHERDAAPLLQLTRGIHLVFKRERLPVSHAVVLRAPDGRSTFVVPRGEYVYAGTTDTLYEGAPEEPGIAATDVSYLMEALRATFVDAPDVDEAVGAWSGVRPLLRQDGKSPSELSRRDEIRSGPGPVVSIAGGKLTTYRRMAERVLEKATEIIGRAPSTRVDSAALPLAGGDLEAQGRARAAASAKIRDPRFAERVWAVYGAEAARIIGANAEATEPIAGDCALSRAEIEHAVDHEMAACLDDVLRRRTSLGLFDIEQAAAAAPSAARILGERLGWSGERIHREAARFREDRIAELSAVRSVAARGAA
jgi:glycerol-3-phosphate dehydrogenase